MTVFPALPLKTLSTHAPPAVATRRDVPQRGERPVVEEVPEPSRYLCEELVARALPEVALHGVEGVVDRIGGLLLHMLAHDEHHAAVHGRAAVLRIAQVEGGVHGPVPAPELLRPVVLREVVPLHGVAPDEPARGVLRDPLLLLGDERVDERVPGPVERRVVRVLPLPPSEKVGKVALALGAGRLEKTDKIDPLAGITLAVRRGDRVSVGSPLATLESSREPDGLERAAADLLKAFTIGRDAPEDVGLVLERVD